MENLFHIGRLCWKLLIDQQLLHRMQHDQLQEEKGCIVMLHEITLPDDDVSHLKDLLKLNTLVNNSLAELSELTEEESCSSCWEVARGV